MSEIEEGLKFATAVVDATSKTGSYVSRLFGKAPEDLIKLLIGDKLELKLYESQSRLTDKLNDDLAKRGITERYRPVPPKFAIPIILNASIEEDDYLQDMWCKLITNCIDPDFDEKIIRYAFIEIIKNLTSLDAKTLKLIYDITIEPNEYYINKYHHAPSLSYEKIKEETNLANREIDMSLDNLERVGCLAYIVISRNYKITELGHSFILACMN